MITKSGWRIKDTSILGPKQGYRFMPIDRQSFKKDILDKIRLKKLKKEYHDMHGNNRLNSQCIIKSNKFNG